MFNKSLHNNNTLNKQNKLDNDGTIKYPIELDFGANKDVNEHFS